MDARVVPHVRLGTVLVAMISAMAAACFAIPAPGGAQASAGPEVDPALKEELAGLGGGESTEAIVTFEGDVSRADVEAARRTGAAVHTFEELPMVAVRGTKAQIGGLFSLDGALSVWGNERLEYLLEESVPLIGADRVRSDLGFDGEGVGVAVLDSGVDATHPDLEYPGRTVQNVKIAGDGFFTGTTAVVEDQPNTDTSSGHGTHVAGTVGGDGTASGGRYTGVAPGSDLVGIGAGDAISILYALEGFDYALAHQDAYNIRVISNSWGTSGEFDRKNPINVASKEAHDRGITVAFAAGNAGPGRDTLNPYSVAPWVIGVAAGNKDGKTLADFSSRGRPGSDLYHPDITAPGVDIVSARASTGSTINALAARKDAVGIPPEHLPFYTTASGTSMATPHVSGTVALMLDANPNLTPDQVLNALTGTATPMPYGEFEAGSGYLDAFAAVERVSGSAAGAKEPTKTGAASKN